MKYFNLLIGISSIALTACNRSNPNIPTPLAAPPASIPPTTSPTASSVSTPPQVTTTVSTSPAATPSPTVTPTIAPVAPLPIGVPVQTGDYQVINELKQPQFMAQSRELFTATKLPNTKVNFNAADLLTVLTSTRKYFKNRLHDDTDLQREGILASQGVTVADVLKTLDFMILTLDRDIRTKKPIRLQDPKFLNTHFRTIQWRAFNPAATDEQRVRLTKYAVFTHPGSRKPTPEFKLGLYALRSATDIDRVRKYTKQDVLNNIYEPKGTEYGAVEPLAYLDRAGLESALMEGTVLIKFTDGTSAYFNVDRNNNLPYIKGLDPLEQKRYWYFRRVNAIKGFGQTIQTKISLKPGVTFAGDVLNIGLGKIVVTESSGNSSKPQLRMGIIADTGGAFLPNLHQLDFLAGIFNSKEEFTAYTRNLPEYAKAYILVKR